MYEVGMYGGCFNPLHIGHISCIIQAANQCKKLFVVLSYSDNENEIPHQERFRWLKQATKDIENVVVVKVKDGSKNKSEYNWEKGSADVQSEIGEHVDVVFCGSDYCSCDNPYRKYYRDSEIVYINRMSINISSTEIRKDPFKYWDYIPKVAQPYFVKKILIVGTESCGKSTLVRNLAKYYNTEYVEEAGRDICDFAGGIDNMIPSDFVEILHKHKIREIEKARAANKLLFIDTECTVTDYYLNLQFENTDVNISNESNLASAISNLNSYDLVLFLEPDVDWVQDGTRTYGSDSIRERNNTELKRMMRIAGIRYHSITGSYQERFVKSIALTYDLIQKNGGLRQMWVKNEF